MIWSFRYTRLAVLLVSVSLLPTGMSRAEIINGGFETADFTGWQTIGQAMVLTNLGPINPPVGSFQALITTGGAAVSSPALEDFLLIPRGASGGAPDPPFASGIASGIRQSFIIDIGGPNQVTFQWDFLTNELTPSLLFNDRSFVAITVSPLDVPFGPLTLADTTFNGGVFLPAAGTGFAEHTGFQTFLSPPLAPGTYILGIAVVDVRDEVANSALLIDNVALVPEPSTHPENAWGCAHG